MTLPSLPVELFLDIASYLRFADKEGLRLTCHAFRNILPPPSKFFRKDAPNIVRGLCLVRRDFLPRLFREGNLFADRDVKACSVCLKVGDREKHFPMEGFQIDGYDVCVDCICCMLCDCLPRSVDKMDLDKCWECYTPREEGVQFPLSGVMDLDEAYRLVCEHCLLDIVRQTLPRGHQQSYKGVEFYTCRICWSGIGCDNVDTSGGGEGDSGEMHTPCQGELMPKVLEEMKPYTRICQGCHMRICGEYECSGWPEGFWDHSSDEEYRTEESGGDDFSEDGSAADDEEIYYPEERDNEEESNDEDGKSVDYGDTTDEEKPSSQDNSGDEILSEEEASVE